VFFFHFSSVTCYGIFPADLSQGFVAQIVDVLEIIALHLTALSGIIQ